MLLFYVQKCTNIPYTILSLIWYPVNLKYTIYEISFYLVISYSLLGANFEPTGFKVESDVLRNTFAFYKDIFNTKSAFCFTAHELSKSEQDKRIYRNTPVKHFLAGVLYIYEKWMVYMSGRAENGQKALPLT